jgi:hypothetical protein
MHHDEPGMQTLRQDGFAPADELWMPRRSALVREYPPICAGWSPDWMLPVAVQNRMFGAGGHTAGAAAPFVGRLAACRLLVAQTERVVPW